MGEKLNENDELRARIQELEDQVNKQVNLLYAERTRRAGNKAEPADDVDPFAKDMVLVEGGNFMMGADDDEHAVSYDMPQHEVILSDFYISKYEVTQKQWREIMGDNPSNFKGDNLPVECVSWDDVQEFIRKLNAKTGMNYRLPTEAEWEYAARGGNRSRGYKYSGSNNLEEVAWYKDNSWGMIHPVGQKRANELGLYDMSGNVWECCSDGYGTYACGSVTNPSGPLSGAGCVIRGGHWDLPARFFLASLRLIISPDGRGNFVGFRLARAR